MVNRLTRTKEPSMSLKNIPKQITIIAIICTIFAVTAKSISRSIDKLNNHEEKLFSGSVDEQSSSQENSLDDSAKKVVSRHINPKNNFRITERNLQTKKNPLGEGIFVYNPQTRFNGTERFFIWLVLDETAYALNGPSKTATPTLKWPREVAEEIWQKTGLGITATAKALDIVFK
jgi:hypothetical protein